MTAYLVFLHYVSFEKSYDKLHENYDRIYRIRYERYSENGESVRFASCCPPVGLRIKELLPEAEKVVRVFHHPVSVSHDKRRFIDFFKTQIVEGRNFLKEFSSDTMALILNETAVKWMEFPDAGSVIGKEIDYWGEIYTVIGVMKDYHQQSPKAAFEPHIYRLLPYGRGVRGIFVCFRKSM